MIIENGQIRIKRKAEPTVTEDGYYKPTEASWSKAIPCQWIIDRTSNNDMVDGEHYKTASYTILVEADNYPCVGEQIMLTDFLGDTVGEFSITSVEPLLAVGQVILRV